MLNWFRPQCPVNVCEKVWIEQRMQWLVEKLGPARLREGEIVLPTGRYFPEAFTGTEADAQDVFQRVCTFLQVDPATLEFEIYPQHEAPHAGGQYRREERSVISVADSQLEDQERLIATLAHEVAHEILLGGGLLTGDEPDHEWLTDLTVIFLGMGVFAANTSVQQHNRRDLNWESWRIARHGYLPARMNGYAFALLAWARGEPKPAWAQWLGVDAATALRDGLRYIQKTGDTLFEPERSAGTGEPPRAQILADLGSSSPSRRVAALWALREQGEAPGQAAVDGVLKNLRDRDPLIRAEAAETLAFVSEASDQVCDALMDALGDEIGHVRVRAALTLRSLQVPLQRRGPSESTLSEELLHLMSHENPAFALGGAQCLAAYGEPCEAAAQPLSRLLKRALAACDYPLLEDLLACVGPLIPDAERFLREDVAGGDDDLWRLIQSGLQQSGDEPLAAESRGAAGPWQTSSSRNMLG